MPNINLYKHDFTDRIGMLPSDPTGSLDDFFIFLRGVILW
jgi:hypothetical protein